ncbi:MAG: lactonase family protein [Bryobacteraceae bacterium]
MRSLRHASVMLLALSAMLRSAPPADAARSAREYLVYFGTYTDKGSKGIYVCRFRPATGKLTPVQLAAETVNPSFLAADPARRYLFAVNEIGDYQKAKSGSVSSFSIDSQTGKLTALNTVATRGADPCHLAVDASGGHVLVANYTGGSVAVLPIQTGGMLGEASDFIQHLGSSVNPDRQKEPHAHDVVLTPDNRFAIVADLGLDKLLVYRYDAQNGKLTSNDPPYGEVKPGTGPRHFAFHPNGKWAYGIGEMGNTITVFDWDGRKGSLREKQTIATLPADFKGENSTAELVIDPSGHYLYGSNRGHDSIAVYAVDSATGMLTLIEDVPTLGKEPRNFALDPTGAYLFAANQNSNTVVVFRVNPSTGRLKPTGDVIEVLSPVCVTFVK